jgi:hypothetical protein
MNDLSTVMQNPERDRPVRLLGLAAMLLARVGYWG